MNKNYRTPCDTEFTEKTPHGNREEKLFGLKKNEKGENEFYIKGITNVYEKIQAFKDECMIENILKRCIDTGDMSILNQREATYEDISNLPTSIIEAKRRIFEAEMIYEHLPEEEKEKYKNFNKFLKETLEPEEPKNKKKETEKTVPEETKGEQVDE